MSDHIRASIERAVEYLTANPDEARYRDSPATASIDGLRCTVTGDNGESVVTDMPEGVGGGGTAPSPGWLFRASVASCVASLITMQAARVGMELDQLEVSVDSESDDRGILGIDDAVPAGPLSLRIAVVIGGGGSSQDLHELVDWATRHCPVSDAITRAVEMSVEVEAR